MVQGNTAWVTPIATGKDSRTRTGAGESKERGQSGSRSGLEALGRRHEKEKKGRAFEEGCEHVREFLEREI